jgi:hypothetical protein
MERLLLQMVLLLWQRMEVSGEGREMLGGIGGCAWLGHPFSFKEAYAYLLCQVNRLGEWINEWVRMVL